MSRKDIKPVGLGITLPILNGKMDWSDDPLSSNNFDFIQDDLLAMTTAAVDGASGSIAPETVGALDITASFQTESDH